MTFDNNFDRLLVLLPEREHIDASEGRTGWSPESQHTGYFDVRQFGLQDPQGMAVDPASGDLLILDSAASSIVRIAPAPTGALMGQAASRVDLQYFGSSRPPRPCCRSLERPSPRVEQHASMHYTKSHPAARCSRSETFHASSQGSQGDGLCPQRRPNGRCLADESVPGRQRHGRRQEKSGSNSRASHGVIPGRPYRGGCGHIPITLVRTTDLAALSPPSPDPSGLTFVSSSNSLLMCDGEVEENVSGITHFQGANVWEMTLTGGIVRTANISACCADSGPDDERADWSRL